MYQSGEIEREGEGTYFADRLSAMVCAQAGGSAGFEGVRIAFSG
jgi:hypothetical protein